MPFPLIFAGPAESAAYFEQIDRFLRLALGDAVAERYRIVIGNPAETAKPMLKGIEKVRMHRLDSKDAFFFNWALNIEHDFQHPFRPTHANMAALNLHRDQPRHLLAADLRRAFSGIVAGNVKEEGMRAIEQARSVRDRRRSGNHARARRAAGQLRRAAAHEVAGGKTYVPCYRIKI